MLQTVEYKNKGSVTKCKLHFMWRRRWRVVYLQPWILIQNSDWTFWASPGRPWQYRCRSYVQSVLSTDKSEGASTDSVYIVNSCQGATDTEVRVSSTCKAELSKSQLCHVLPVLFRPTTFVSDFASHVRHVFQLGISGHYLADISLGDARKAFTHSES